MSSLLSSTLAQTSRNQHLLLLQSSAAQTCLPVLRAIVQRASGRTRDQTILFCFLYPPSSFLDSNSQHDHIQVVDRTSNVPGYDATETSEKEWVGALKREVLDTVRSGPLNIIIDSADTLLSDIESLSETTRLFSELLSLVRTRGGSSRLILHTLSPTPLLPLLTQPRFSPSLTHLTAHPPTLLTHLAAAYLTPPPPLSPPEKFWGVFLPIAERPYESEQLVFGPRGAGSSHPEFVLDVLVRGGGNADGFGPRRGVERVLEGWSPAAGGPCALQELEGLSALWARKPVLEDQNGTDPTQNLSFNLNLTLEQQRSRAQVPLPYAHEGRPVETPAAILYDPDSADDLDDDDPDEDLDI